LSGCFGASFPVYKPPLKSNAERPVESAVELCRPRPGGANVRFTASKLEGLNVADGSRLAGHRERKESFASRDPTGHGRQTGDEGMATYQARSIERPVIAAAVIQAVCGE
jgi:hypothetical protein